MEHRKKFLWTQIVNISAAVVLGMLCLQELRSLLIPLRQTHLSSLTVCFHEVPDSFVNPCSNTGTKAWPLPGEQIQHTTGPAWLLPPSPMALPCFWYRQNWAEMASSSKLLTWEKRGGKEPGSLAWSPLVKSGLGMDGA